MHRLRASSLIVIVSAVLGAPPLHAVEPLGRLFLTPEKRETLDKLRALNTLQSQTENDEPQILINGHVQRSSGKRTTWINGQTQPDNDNRLGVVARPDTAGSGRVIIDADEGKQTPVKVGETLNRGTQEVHSPLGDGRIIINRSSGQKTR